MIKKIGIFIARLAIILMPFAYSFGAGLIPDCNKTGTAIDPKTGEYVKSCGINEVVLLVNNIIHFLLFTIATPLVALILCYVGWLLLTSGGSSEKSTKAKHIFTNVVIGYVIGLSAWLIVKWITSALGFTGETFLK
jgi:hypothetical protein